MAVVDDSWTEFFSEIKACKDTIAVRLIYFGTVRRVEI